MDLGTHLHKSLQNHYTTQVLLSYYNFSPQAYQSLSLLHSISITFLKHTLLNPNLPPFDSHTSNHSNQHRKSLTSFNNRSLLLSVPCHFQNNTSWLYYLLTFFPYFIVKASYSFRFRNKHMGYHYLRLCMTDKIMVCLYNFIRSCTYYWMLLWRHWCQFHDGIWFHFYLK